MIQIYLSQLNYAYRILDLGYFIDVDIFLGFISGYVCYQGCTKKENYHSSLKKSKLHRQQKRDIIIKYIRNLTYYASIFKAKYLQTFI